MKLKRVWFGGESKIDWGWYAATYVTIVFLVMLTIFAAWAGNEMLRAIFPPEWCP